MTTTWENTDPPDLRVRLYFCPHLNVDEDHSHCGTGLLNFSKNCYVNSTVQALLHLPPFIGLVGNHKRTGRKKCHNNCILCIFDIIRETMKSRSILSHKPLLHNLHVINPKFTVYNEEDAHEFIQFLLSVCVEQELARFKPMEMPFCLASTTGVHAVFGMWMKTVSVCSTCQYSHQVFSNIFYVMISVAEKSVQNGLNKFLSERDHILDYKCPGCFIIGKPTGSCLRNQEFHTYPKVLPVTLDRFGGSLTCDKKDLTPVAIDKTIRIGQFNYTFMCGVVHIGNLRSTGHYKCVAACPNGSLKYFNDNKVLIAPELTNDEMTSGIYILFYQKDEKPFDKRPRPPTPSKYSPSNKKPALKVRHPLQKRVRPTSLKHLSPTKRMKTSPVKHILCAKESTARRLSFRQSILKKASSNMDDTLALPLQLDDASNMLPKDDCATPAVIPKVVIQRRRRLEPKDSASQSSHEYSIVGQNREHAEGKSEKKKHVPPLILIPEQFRSKEVEAAPEVSIQKDADSDSDLFEDEFIEGDRKQLIDTVKKRLPQPPSQQHVGTGTVDEIGKGLRGPGRTLRPRTLGAQEAPVVLTAADIPGAILPKATVEHNTVRDLRRWLKCHGQCTSGNKTVLVSNVLECMKLGQPPPLKENVDQNRWRREKLDRERLRNIHKNSQAPFPEKGFGAFPSNDLPRTFNFGSVFHYLIETRPQFEGEGSDSDSSGDDEEEDMEMVRDPFQDSKCHTLMRAKTFRRGMMYVKSKWVLGMQDCVQNDYHYIKAHVRASYDAQAYWVYVTVSQITGGVCNAVCGDPCPAAANGRCAHVSATLLQMLAHVHLNGYDAITCTSRPCEWNKGSLKHNPSAVSEKQYSSFKINVKKRANFDPRPTDFKILSQERINNFIGALSYKKQECYWQLHMSVVYENFTFDDEDMGIFEEKRVSFYQALMELITSLKPNPFYEGPIEVPETEGQSDCELWFLLRSLHCTASLAKAIMHLKSATSIRRFLRTHLWRLEQFTSRAMKYGTNNEDIARKAYLLHRRQGDDSVQVKTAGLHLHTKHVGMSCSPDGLVTSKQHKPRILEIKAPFSLRKVPVNEFDTALTKKQQQKFCLKRTPTGQILLKESHDYYYQVQMNMGMVGCDSCDLFVWSTEGHVTVNVPFNPPVWHDIQMKLKMFHWQTLVPEYFAMRTPRKLEAITLLLPFVYGSSVC